MDTSLNPRTQSEWARTARSEGLNPETVTPFNRKYGSASVLKFAEFLNLKVLWNRRPAQDFRIGDFVHEGPMTEANRIDLRELRNVVGTVKGEDPHPSNRLKDKSAPPPNGLFTTFHYFTHLVMRSQSRDHQASPKISRPRRNAPRIMPDNIITDLEKLHLGDTPRALDLRTSPRTPATQLGPGNEDFGTPFVGEVPPRTEYEATVNMGLITMLCAIRLHCSSLKDGHWLPDPKPFDLRDPTTRDSPAILQARVDGYLSKKGQFDTAFAIVEVKPYSRTLKRKKIEWQEAAQMAAWVSQTTGNRMGTLASPENVRRYVLLSVMNILYATTFVSLLFASTNAANSLA
ncbi:hypothetical protein HMPREF1624_00146 [Sporothrix schenckii ATCC 58251]|uniref:Uncharacterized protein n=1 Tax=Sporothrix schenckii (strain ATCC 58251 / de Perez 2211183) TaxID=1391915 RepID=U7Q3T0_SPOS1|nr:hypothetical protein HMPREF1624_00146 [Sporothrix schenckii ATCC 58251]